MNSNRMGSIDWMVASRVVVPVVPPVTRLPGETRRSPMRPDTGARSSVNSRSSSACRTAASCAVTLASRDALGLRALLEGLLRYDIAAEQVLSARQIGFGERQIGLGLGQTGAGLIQRVLERPPIHGEQQVALVDQLAVLEMNLFQIARDPRPHFDAHRRRRTGRRTRPDRRRSSSPAAPPSPAAARWRSLCLRFAALARGKRQTECAATGKRPRCGRAKLEGGMKPCSPAAMVHCSDIGLHRECEQACSRSCDASCSRAKA